MSSRKTKVTPRGDRAVLIERIFDAPRDRVWRAFTDPAQLAQWWGRGNELVIEKFDLRRGGHWRFVEKTAGGPQGFEGRFRVVEPPSRLEQTFDWDGSPGHVMVNCMTLEEVAGGKTKLVVEATAFAAEDSQAMLKSGMEEGMNASYDALDRVLAKPEPAAAAARTMVEKVAFTMIPVKDAARARKFYEEVLGLTVGMAGGKGSMHWIEYDLPGGGCVALTNTTGNAPSTSAGATVSLEVADLRGLLDRLKSLSVEIKTDVIRGPHCSMAVCVDSEGNGLLLHQLDAKG
jgi:uncharacterized protein YndB with AHSA1/START domain/predicted enzyme related to lactoylglutathione lyase